jgi:hypothetical protein
MKRLIRLSAAWVVVLILGMIAGASTSIASAPEFVLQEGSFPVTFTGSSGSAVLETVGKTLIKCSRSKSKGELTGSKAGSLDISFEECSSETAKCKSTGSGAGVILTEGSAKVVLTNLLPVGAGFLAEPKEYSIECESLTSAKVKGAFLVPLQADLTQTLLESLLVQKAGKPLFTSYWDSAGKEHTTLLQASIKGGAFEEAAYGATSPQFTFAKEVELRTGELTEANLVKTTKFGGTAGGGASLCEFTAINQTCEVAVENISTETLQVISQNIFETVSNVHYFGRYIKFVSIGGECKSSGWITLGTVLPAGTSCNVKLELTRAIPALPSEVKGSYEAIILKTVGGTLTQGVMRTEAKE